jgi:hypothetical protein
MSFVCSMPIADAHEVSKSHFLQENKTRRQTEPDETCHWEHNTNITTKYECQTNEYLLFSFLHTRQVFWKDAHG